MKQKKVEIKKANSLIFFIVRIILSPFLWLKYRFKFDRKTVKGIRRPCFILSNHQASFDQFSVTMGFYFGVNIVASDSLFRHGLSSRLMKALARPIPISKGTTDTVAVKHIMQIIKAGGAVEMFPSGNRSFFGEESTINPAVGKLAKKLNVPVVLVNSRGGFNTKSRWMHKPSKGKMRLSVVRVITAQEMSAMTDDEVFEVISRELSFNEFEWNRTAQVVFKGKHKAEYLEAALFYCPHCHAMDGMTSHKNELFCNKCGARLRINATGFLENVESALEFPDNMADWGRIQLQYIKGIDYSDYKDKPLFEDGGITLSLIRRAEKDEFINSGSIRLFEDRISVCGKDFSVAQIKDMSLQGARRLQIYTDEGAYTLDAPARTNLVKYMVCGYRLRNAALNIEEEFYGY